jgi:flagella basal body P-ring formation protein FlgA
MRMKELYDIAQGSALRLANPQTGVIVRGIAVAAGRVRVSP